MHADRLLKLNGVRAAVFASALTFGGRATAQEPPPGDEIVVTGVRQGTLDLPRLLKARVAFVTGRPSFAPTSALFFQIRPAAGVSLAGMTLVLRSDETRIAVPIDPEGRFSLPDLPRGHWQLLHNRGKAVVAVRALVISAGATELDRPLGDLRLQCRAGWELAKADRSVFARAGFDAIGGCASSRIVFFFRTPRPIVTATITAGGTVRGLEVKPDRSAYHAPLDDRSLPNGALIHVVSR